MAAWLGPVVAGMAVLIAVAVLVVVWQLRASIARRDDGSAALGLLQQQLDALRGQLGTGLSGQSQLLGQHLSQLTAQSFRGTVRLEIFSGRFCLVGNPTEGFSVAPEELAYAKCELVGNPALENMAPAQRQSLGFVNMIAEAERLSGGDIHVNVVTGNAERQAAPYPNSAGDGLTAGQWNRAASVNNRIEISAVAGT